MMFDLITKEDIKDIGKFILLAIIMTALTFFVMVNI